MIKIKQKKKFKSWSTAFTQQLSQKGSPCQTIKPGEIGQSQESISNHTNRHKFLVINYQRSLMILLWTQLSSVRTILTYEDVMSMHSYQQVEMDLSCPDIMCPVHETLVTYYIRSTSSLIFDISTQFLRTLRDQLFIIDREAREIMYLVASVRLSVSQHSHGWTVWPTTLIFGM